MAPPWPPFRCSVPDCEYETPEGTKDQMFAHLTLHTSAVHLAHQEAVLAVPAVPAARIERLLPVRAFMARLTGTADCCSMTVKCSPCQVDLSCRDEVAKPSIKPNSTEEDWEEFIESWEKYKEEYSLSGLDLIKQLKTCMPDQMRQSLYKVTGGDHFRLSERDLLTHIKTLAIQHLNPEVLFEEFLNLSPRPNEGVRQYLTRRRDLASRFAQIVNCEGFQALADEFIKLDLIAVLSGQKKKGIDDIVKDIEAKESGNLAMISVDEDDVSSDSGGLPESNSRGKRLKRPNQGVSSFRKSKKIIKSDPLMTDIDETISMLSSE